MAAASDKARFYIEQTVPDLREWERRQLFTKPEIQSITSQRTGFETQLNSREATPALYIRYLTYESNISLLLSKRLTRHAVPQKSAQKLRTSQQRRLFKILDRATIKFKGDLGLWAQYLHFCREQAAVKRGQKVLTECLRLFPTRPEVWGYAAGWAEGSGDLSAARGYYLRGLRFCGNTKGGKDLYLRFARAEMRWIKERRKVLGLEGSEIEEHRGLENGTTQHSEQARREEVDADVISDATNNQRSESDTAAAASHDPKAFHHFSSTPAMTGAIPIAVFDQAMKAYSHSSDLAETFFDKFAQFSELPCTRRVLQHVVQSMTEAANPDLAVIRSCQCRMPLIGTAVDSPDFPSVLRKTLAEVKSSLTAQENDDDRARLQSNLLTWLKPLAEDEKLVPELETILDGTVRRLSHPQRSHGCASVAI